MSAQILTTSNICVETIESIEDEFNITSSNSIIFETDNILIGNVSFTEFCSNIVFGVPIEEITKISSEDIFKVNAGSITNKDEITNMSEYELVSIDCTQITSDETYETGTNKEHYVNIQGKEKIYITSENIFVKHHSYDESFHDYTYRMINNKSISDSLGQYHFNSRGIPKEVHVLTDPQNTRIADVTDMGTYVTKKILCNAITTENIYNSQNKEAQLKLKSNSAIRLNLMNDVNKNKNNIFIEDDGVPINLNQYINYRLDEYGLINIDLEAEPGVDITIYFNQTGLGQGFSNYYNYIPEFQTKQYKVNFKIVLNKGPYITYNIPSIATNIGIYDSYHEPIIGPDVTDLATNGIIYHTTGIIDNIFHDTTNTIKYPMTNLTAGNFYNIYADVTNNFTGITYYNILTSAVNVPTIEHVVIDRIAVINEREIEIDFAPHVTVVPTWFKDPYKLVYFSVKLYNHGDSSNLSDGADFTYIEVAKNDAAGVQKTSQLTYDIGKSETRQNRIDTQLKYRFDVNKLSDYENPLSSEFQNYSDSVIKLNGLPSDATRDTVEHIFSIVSNHTAGNFEMISIPEFTMPTESFGIPNAPTNFSVQYPEGTTSYPSRNNIFQWTRSTNSDSRITKLFYEIFKDYTSITPPPPRLNTNDMEDDLTNYYNLASPNFTSSLNQNGVTDSSRILQNIGTATRDQVEGIIPGTYKIRAYNFFGQRSDFAEYTVTELKLNINDVKLTPILDADKIWKVSYNVVNPNGTFVVTTDVTTVVITSVVTPSPIANNSEFFMTNDFNDFTTYYVWVQIQDTAMKIKSSNISVTITRPTINISAGVYTGGASKDRRYTFIIGINTKSLNDTSDFDVPVDANESLNIRSLTDIYNVTSMNNSTYSIIENNSDKATITFTVNDFYASRIDTHGGDTSDDINVSFSLIATDVYGYSSESTTLTNTSNIVNIYFPNRSTDVEHVGDRQFNLDPAYSSDFIRYDWELNNSSLGKTNSTLSFSDIEDNAMKFGNFRCKIKQKNDQGFTRYFYSASLNNPEPIISISQVFTILTTRTYSFSYSGNGTTSLLGTYTQNSPNLLQKINNNTVTSEIRFTQNRTYTLQVFVRNKYYFGQFQTIGTFTVVRPSNPTLGTIEKNTHSSVTLKGFNWGNNGTPNEAISAYKYTKDSSSGRINLNSSEQFVTLILGTTYTFRIYKQYTDYGEFASNSLSITTPTAVSFNSPTKDFHSVTVNYNLNVNGSYTLYSGYPKLIWSYSSSFVSANTINLSVTSTSNKIVIGHDTPEKSIYVKIQKKFQDTSYSSLDTTYGSPTAITVNSVDYPDIPSISSTSVNARQITLTISTNHTGSSYPYPNEIHLYWHDGGPWQYINITLNASNQYTFNAPNYNTIYTLYVDIKYHGYSDGKPNINKLSTQVSIQTETQPPDSPRSLYTTVHALFINLSWTGGNNYDATGVTYSINLNGYDVKTGLTTTNYLLTWRSDEGNLRQNTRYTIYIKKVYSLSGSSDLYTQSGSISRTTLSGPYPSINTTSSSVTHNSINLVWTTGSRATDNISTSNIKYRIEVRKMSGPSEGGVVELNKGYINNISYTTNNYTITNYTSSSGTTYNIESNSTYYIKVYKNITYYSSANIMNWSSFSDYRVTTPQYVEPYWPNITSNSIDGKEITITYSTGDPGSRTRSGVELSISKNGGGFSTIIQFSIYSTTGSHTETLPEYDTEYYFQMAVKYDSNTYTKFQSGYHTYRTEEEPAPDPTIQISDNWRLVNHNGRGIDYGNKDSLIGVKAPTIGTNRFPLADYTLDYVKSVANTYDTAAYIVDNRRAVHLSYYIHDAVHGDYHVYTPNMNDPHDGLIFVYTRNDYDSTDLETQGTTFTGWHFYDDTNYYGTLVRDWILISDYPYNTANVEYILGLGEASVATKHVVYNESLGKWFFTDDNPPSGGTPVGGEQWYSPINNCKVWSKTYS